MAKGVKIVVLVLTLLILTITVASAEARTFRKAVKQESTDLGARPLAVGVVLAVELLQPALFQ